MKTWHKLALFWGPVAALTGVAAAGRCASPVKTEEKLVQQDRTAIVEKIDEKRIAELLEQNRQYREEISELRKSIHRETRMVQRPDGTVETIKTEDINVSQTVKQQEVKVVEREVKVVEVKYVDRVVEVEKLVVQEKVTTPTQSSWRLTPMVGLNLRPAGALIPGPLTYGAAVQHHVVGGLYAGGFALSSGQVGLAFTMEF